MTDTHHDPTLHTSGRHGCWAICPCGWTSARWVDVMGAHLEFGRHLTDDESERP